MASHSFELSTERFDANSKSDQSALKPLQKLTLFFLSNSLLSTSCLLATSGVALSSLLPIVGLLLSTLAAGMVLALLMQRLQKYLQNRKSQQTPIEIEVQDEDLPEELARLAEGLTEFITKQSVKKPNIQIDTGFVAGTDPLPTDNWETLELAYALAGKTPTYH